MKEATPQLNYKGKKYLSPRDNEEKSFFALA
jgi:hypothetical protein